MRAKLFKFYITDFEEVYVVIDDDNQRLHISPLNYSYNITLDLTKDLNEEVEKQTKYGELSFNGKVQKVANEIIKELKLS